MAFVKENGNVVSFAEYDDLVVRDKLLIQTHDELDDSMLIDDHMKRATERILSKLRSTDWWREYFISRSSISYRTVADIPALNANYIKDRNADFTDLCVYVAIATYILPMFANFGQDDTAEVEKMKYYEEKATKLFDELVSAGDWYDFDGSGVISSDEKEPFYNNKRMYR